MEIRWLSNPKRPNEQDRHVQSKSSIDRGTDIRPRIEVSKYYSMSGRLRQSNHRPCVRRSHADRTFSHKVAQQLAHTGRTYAKGFGKGSVTSAQDPLGVAHHVEYPRS
jgi:hypothetical protein